jgi:DNA-binding MarR family transcriptional regulator
MTRIVASLVETGLVTRTGHQDDARRAVVALTPRRRRTVYETRSRPDAWSARRPAEV